jgi:GT2 family glycosyltransferase
MSARPSVAILLLNWNGYRDTIECLETLFRLDYPADRLTVILCDNASTDGSKERIREWCSGERPAPDDVPASLLPLFRSPLRKPISMVELDAGQAAVGGGGHVDAPLVWIDTGANLGFAGGNNIGLTYLARRNAHDLIWILNNDIDVAADSLGHLVDALAEDSSLGAVAGRLMEYLEPDVIQIAGGGVVDMWRGGPRPVRAAVKRLDYLSGGCMLIPLEVARRVGLIAEEYFLYGEDVDYSLRIRKAGLDLGYVEEAVGWHKGGAAVAHFSPRHDYYVLRNNLFIMRKYFPALFPLAVASMIYRFVLPKIVRREWTRLAYLRRALADFRHGAMGRIPAALENTRRG